MPHMSCKTNIYTAWIFLGVLGPRGERNFLYPFVDIKAIFCPCIEGFSIKSAVSILWFVPIPQMLRKPGLFTPKEYENRSFQQLMPQ